MWTQCTQKLSFLYCILIYWQTVRSVELTYQPLGFQKRDTRELYGELLLLPLAESQCQSPSRTAALRASRNSYIRSMPTSKLKYLNLNLKTTKRAFSLNIKVHCNKIKWINLNQHFFEDYSRAVNRYIFYLICMMCRLINRTTVLLWLF